MDVQTRNRMAAGMLVAGLGGALVFIAIRALPGIMRGVMRSMMKEMMAGDNGFKPPEM